MSWMQNLIRGLGTQNAPFGFDAMPVTGNPSQFDPAYGAGMQMLGNIGAGMLANINENPAKAFGRAYLGAQEMSRENNKQDYVAAQMLQQAEDKKREQQAEREQQEQFNAWVDTLPPEQQGLARMFPDKFGAEMVKQQFPDPQGGADSSNWGMSPIPLYNSKTKQYAVGQFNQGQGGVFVNGQPIAGTDWQPYDPYSLNQQKAAGTATGKEMGGAAAALPGAQMDVQAMNDKIDMIRDNPSLGSAIGYGNALGDYFVGNDVLAIRSQLNELEGGAFLSAYSSLKGGGQITEIESAQAKQAIADMQTARKMSDVNKFKEALERFRAAVNRGYQKLQAQAGQYAPGTPAPDATSGNTRYKFNSTTGELE